MSQVYGEAPSFSIMDVLRGMGRRKLLMIGSLAIGTLLGLAVVTVMKPKYQSEARVLIDNFATPYDSANVTLPQTVDSRVDERTIGSQVAVLSSEDLGKRIISTLKLSERPEFDPMKKGLGMVKQFLIKSGFSDDPRLKTVEQRAWDEVNGSLTVYPLPLSNVIAIKYVATDGQVAADVANTLAQTYVLSTRENRTGDTDRARLWLSSQIDGLRNKVAESDAAVEKYRTEAGLLKGQTATLGAQEISELNSQITLAEAARTEAAAKADEIRNLLEIQGSVEASSEVLASPTIQRLREQQLAAERRLTDLSVTYLDNHPKMRAAQKDIIDIDNRIRREALKVVDGLQGQAKIAAARAASLRKSLEGLKTREGGAAQDEVKLKVLEREAKANRDQLEIMLARFADSNTRQNLELQPGFARVIQEASVPASPFFPRVGPIILLASLAGLGLGLGLAFLFEIMAQATRISDMAMQAAGVGRNRHPAHEVVENDDEIPTLDVPPPQETLTPVSVQMPVAPPVKNSIVNVTTANTSMAPITLASIPQARTGLEARALVAALSSGGIIQSTLGQISLHLQAMRSKGSLKACAVAGVGGGSEVPALALALSRNLADSGLKTILVDLESHRSILPDLLELDHAPGLTELLTGSSDFSKAIQRDKLTELQFLRHGSLDVVEAAQLPVRMEAIIKTLIGIYDVVVLHVGEASPAMLQLAKGCSTVLVNTPVSRKKDAIAASGTLHSKGFEHIFLIQVDGTQRAAA
jgi:polysaccharide biosynthesis transport protein